MKARVGRGRGENVDDLLERVAAAKTEGGWVIVGAAEHVDGPWFRGKYAAHPRGSVRTSAQ